MLRTVVRPKVVMQWVKTSPQVCGTFSNVFHTVIVEAVIMKSLI